MGSDKVIVIGHSPGKTPINKRKNGSPTLNRLNRWLDACNVDIYSFSNLCASHKEFLKSSDIDGILIQKITNRVANHIRESDNREDSLKTIQEVFNIDPNA